MLSGKQEVANMSERADQFVATWVSENINAEGYQPEGDYTEARNFAEQCLTAAKAAGIAESEINDEYPDLVSYMAAEIEEANDREVARLSEKDD
jgi:hypothetical protein